MSDLREVDLTRLSHGARKTLCHQYRKSGLLPPTANCDTSNENELLGILTIPVTYVSALARAERAKRTTTSRRDPVPSPMPIVPADILLVIGQYVDYHILLGLLAACPTETLTRDIYNTMSGFWDRRLQCLTGRGCLKERHNTMKCSRVSPWSIKAQHDAALPRAGYLVVGALKRIGRSPLGQRNERIMVYTNRRVKSLINYTTERYVRRISGENVESEIYQLLALWEDGTVRYFDHVIDVLPNGGTDVSRLTSSIEDDSYWYHVMAAPRMLASNWKGLPRLIPPPVILPRMRMAAPSRGHKDGRDILCLDYEGALWYGTYDPVYRSSRYRDRYDPLLITLAKITPDLGSESLSIGRIVHFTVVEGKSVYRDDRLDGPRIDGHVAIIMNDEGREYLLNVNNNAITMSRGILHVYHMPIYYPLGESRLVAYDGECGDGSPHTLSALDVQGSILPSQAVGIYHGDHPSSGEDSHPLRLVFGEPSASDRKPYRYDVADEAARYVTVLDGGTKVVSAPIGYGSITNPAPYDGSQPGTDAVELQGYLSDYNTFSVKYRFVRIYPRWSLGMVPALPRNDASDVISQRYTFIQAQYAASQSQYASTSTPERLALLAPDGSVTLIGMSEEPLSSRISGTSLYALSLDLEEASGGSVVAMLQVARSLSGKTMVGVTTEGSVVFGVGV